MTDKNILIAYYSYSGNTKEVAKIIQEITGGTMFSIEPAIEYPPDYNEVVKIAQKEKTQNIMPKLKNQIDISNYDTIFIGTPVWWYTFASPIRTFLSSNDFVDKTIIPFCTHGGGGASSTYEDMKKICKNSNFKNGFTSYGNTAAKEEIETWLKGF